MTKLLVDVGAACAAYQNKALRGLHCRRIQCDEIWSFVGCKQKTLRPGAEGTGRGDAWTFTAIDADTKLVPCWLVGKRDLDHATAFMEDLAGRLANRVQLTHAHDKGAKPERVTGTRIGGTFRRATSSARTSRCG